MTETPSSTTLSTKLERIAKLAREAPRMAFTTLAHHIDIDWLREAYRRTRKDGAAGVDGQTAEEYAANLEENLQSLLDRAKSGTYRAPPVRRVHIPKGDGSETRPHRHSRPSRIRSCSGRSRWCWRPCTSRTSWTARTASGQGVRRIKRWTLCSTERCVWQAGGSWRSISRSFSTPSTTRHLREILRQRVRDGVVLRLIGKWLNAGVLEDGSCALP